MSRKEKKDTPLQKMTVSKTDNPGVPIGAKVTPAIKKLNPNAKPWVPRQSPSRYKETS